MKIRNFLAMLILPMAISFAGCEKTPPEYVTPEITSDIEGSLIQNVSSDGETKTVNVTSNTSWTATDDADWIIINPPKADIKSGTKTTTKVDLTIEANTTSEARDAEVIFTISSTTRLTITVKQLAKGGEPVGGMIFYDDFDKVKAEKDGNDWPETSDLDAFNPTGTAITGVDYGGENVQFRSNQESSGEYSGYPGSGVNNVFFRTKGVLKIQKIDLTAVADKSFTLTFGCYRGVWSEDENYNNAFKISEFHAYVSGDGVKWTELTYTRPEDPVSKYGKWNLATAGFTLKDKSEKLYIAFTSDLSSSHRLDDVTLSTGGGGAEIDLSTGGDIGGGGVTPGEGLTVIQGITAEGEYVVEEATVTATHEQGFMIGNETGIILVFMGEDHDFKIGDKVKVDGTVEDRFGILQFGKEPLATVTKLSSGATPVYPTPTITNGDGIDAYAISYQYMEVTGTLEVKDSGKGYNFYNVKVDGAAKMLSVPYSPSPVDALNGKKVVLKGYTIGFAGTEKTIINVIAASIVEEGAVGGDAISVNPTSMNWVADNKDAKTATVTASGEWSVTAKPEWLTATESGNTLTVTPLAINATETKKEGTITLTCGTKTATVTVVQAGVLPATATPIKDVVLGETYLMEGKVTALTSEKGFIFTDGSGSILCYEPVGTFVIGDDLTITGEIGDNNKGLRIIGEAATIVKKGTNSAPSYPTPTTYAAAQFDAFAANEDNRLATYVTYEGEYKDGGWNKNVIIAGTENQGSLYYPDAAFLGAIPSGATVKVTGYVIALAGSKYVNTVVTAFEAVGDYIAVDPDALTWTAADLEPKTVTVSASGTWTIDATAATWVNATKGEDNTLVITPLAANTAETDKPGTITLTCGTKTATITVTQKGVVPAGGGEVTFVFADMSYTHGEAATPATVEAITATFAQNTHSSLPPRWWTDAVRMYNGNNLTLTGATITKVEFTFAGDSYGTITPSEGALTDAIWAGSSDSLVFTVPTEGNQTRIQKMVVTYE